MNLRQFAATALAAAAAATTIGISPAQAQIYGYGNGWRQPIQSGPVIRPTQSGSTYGPSHPVMQQPNFGQPRHINNPGGFGQSNASYFRR
jgi:hypothetical protein